MLYHFEPWESFPEGELDPPEDVGLDDEDECEDPRDEEDDDE
jgi:hypothetical protein